MKASCAVLFITVHYPLLALLQRALSLADFADRYSDYLFSEDSGDSFGGVEVAFWYSSQVNVPSSIICNARVRHTVGRDPYVSWQYVFQLSGKGTVALVDRESFRFDFILAGRFLI